MTQDKTPASKKSFSVDWLLRGTLTKVGDIFDRFTGRGWKPSSSIATSELIERLKKLLDSEVKDLDKKGKFVPHNIKLKMQWDKFSTDAEEALKKLEYELLTAVIDHINDNRYHTYAPLKLEIKPDYFTEGVKLLASFDKFAEEKEAELNVTVPNLKNIVIAPLPEIAPAAEEKEIYIVEFKTGDKSKRVELAFSSGQRQTVGRTKENALNIDDASVSKVHAAFVLNGEKQLLVADTGSTNGTFVNDKRIAYGKAIPVTDGDKIKFGTVEASITYVPKEVEETVEPEEIPLPNSSVATQLIIAGEDELKTENVSLNTHVAQIAHESPVATELPEKSADSMKTFQEEASEKESLKTFQEEAPDGDASPPVTEQRISFDFGENK
ncbi:MAG TPA: FHA domain-containing protein [Pyrinomonadaceae bacterium]|jgi:pSer/pThr/pTyr-binding forkhead associated (FHA) protein